MKRNQIAPFFLSIALAALQFSFGLPAAYAFGAKNADTVAASTAAPKSDSLVWVSRKDGAVSCGGAKVQSLEEGARELTKSGVKVFDSGKGNDGKMHAQACGMATGSLNTYQISRDDLPKALALGFAEEKSK